MSDVLMFHPTDWYDFHHEMYQNFHNQIVSLYTIEEAKTIDESPAALDSPSKPKLVLLVHGGICDKEYFMVTKKVSSYAKEGGTVIMCLNFATFLKRPNTKWIFQRYFGLTWKLGNYTRQDFTLNNMFNKDVKALNISKVSQHSQIYMVNDEVKSEAPVIFKRYAETGFIGYIGDVNNETGSQDVLLAMLDKAINNNTQRALGEPTKVKHVQPDSDIKPAQHNNPSSLTSNPKDTPSQTSALASQLAYLDAKTNDRATNSQIKPQNDHQDMYEVLASLPKIIDSVTLTITNLKMNNKIQTLCSKHHEEYLSHLISWGRVCD
ncbi:hypothetical protein DFH28DRAFT_1194438 [Melampsora americana]|nr:hypothetical protein DFH28DRAFT_1194438 [Melampsora americana]